MTYSSIVISSGHGKYIRGAAGSPVPPQLDEVDEARRVVDRVAAELRQRGVQVEVFHDDTSHDQNSNLNWIVNHHNSCTRQLDISVHFNAYDGSAHGTEVLYVSQEELAKELSAAISEAAHTTDRGPKYRSDLFFLNNTSEPAVLIETVFCDNTNDSNLYRQHFDAICAAIVDTLSDEDADIGRPPRPARPPPGETEALLHVVGKCSLFGGPEDTGVSQSEGLAFHYSITPENQHLFLPIDAGTGLARRLNPTVHYVACRWNYSVTPKEMLADKDYMALVRNTRTGDELLAFPADWGPHEDTGRIADLSPGLMLDLGLVTDDEVEVTYPHEA